ncbi:MAG: hypothetical protein QF898_11115 [SAR202 cluster bacterium]|nr:hypothetical protein [SAR202 cluster bacterium]MDP6514988.1 hypothetical protein [SAR202 cluster bacterium]MDP6716061.1 hypothetical protein [SAR202 cluster bacterium]
MSYQDSDAALHWVERVSEFVPTFIREHPGLGLVAECGDLILTGSTTQGVVDEHSDLDLELVLPEDAVAQVDSVSSTRYIEFHLDGKPGSVIVVSAEAWNSMIDACDMPLIAELRQAVMVTESTGIATKLIEKARQTMTPEVRRAFFFYNYFEMRSFHRGADNPLNRNDAVPAYLNTSQALLHALRACLSLEGEPYPYDKWLWKSASQTETGQKLSPHVNSILDHLADDALRLPGPESDNPLSQDFREIRGVLIDSARQSGIDEPWLVRWWEHINQARSATSSVRW